MRRREFISIIGSVMVQPFAAGAQQQALPVIGFLSLRGAGGSDDLLAAFRNGLREAGFVEGQNVAIEYRWAEGQHDRLPALAGDLVRRQVNVIFANTSLVPAQVAKAATATIPIVFRPEPIRCGSALSRASIVRRQRDRRDDVLRRGALEAAGTAAGNHAGQ